MENMTFEELVKINCFSEVPSEQKQAAELLEQRYCCEIRCADMMRVYVLHIMHAAVQ